MEEYNTFVGLDVHKDEISVGIAEAGREAPVLYGKIPNDSAAIRKLASRFGVGDRKLSFCYEAGPCGYEVYRVLSGAGYHCAVVAPALIPIRPGDRIKTDGRDAVQLSRLHRSGDLTPVWVPDAAHEALRDLCRAREDAKKLEHKARQNLTSFLLRHGKRYSNGKHWTKGHFAWIRTVTFEHRADHIVLEEYVDTVEKAQLKVAALAKALEQQLENWSLRPLAEALMALRGIEIIVAMTILTEVGDLSRFQNPAQLMSYLGLVPSEHSSGDSQRRGRITKAGNAHVRRVLIEAAWTYRYPPRKSRTLAPRLRRVAPAVQDISWKAQQRLHHKLWRLHNRGKPIQKALTAVARELVGFIWAVAQKTQTL